MPERDPKVLIADILAAVQKIERYIAGMDQTAFLQDEKTIDAVVRNLEIIGEAARRMPDSFTAQHSNVPWRQIAGLRNRIVHDYFGLDLEIIWGVLARELPKLKADLAVLS